MKLVICNPKTYTIAFPLKIGKAIPKLNPLKHGVLLQGHFVFFYFNLYFAYLDRVFCIFWVPQKFYEQTNQKNGFFSKKIHFWLNYST